MSEAPSKKHVRVVRLRICLLGMLFLVFLGSTILYFRSRPQWILLIDNEPDAMRISVVTTKSETPVYQVHVRGEQFPSAPLRLPATEAENVDIEGIKTLYVDSSLGPGRWTVQVGSVKLDFWIAYLFVDGKQYTPPADVTVGQEQAR